MILKTFTFDFSSNEIEAYPSLKEAQNNGNGRICARSLDELNERIGAASLDQCLALYNANGAGLSVSKFEDRRSAAKRIFALAEAKHGKADKMDDTEEVKNEVVAQEPGETKPNISSGEERHDPAADDHGEIEEKEKTEVATAPAKPKRDRKKKPAAEKPVPAAAPAEAPAAKPAKKKAAAKKPPAVAAKPAKKAAAAKPAAKPAKAAKTVKATKAPAAPKKAAAKAPKPAKAAAKKPAVAKPAKKAPTAPRASIYDGRRFVANGDNPHREGTPSHGFFDAIKSAGKRGITVGEYLEAVKKNPRASQARGFLGYYLAQEVVIDKLKSGA